MQRKRFFGRPLKKTRGWKKKRRSAVKVIDVTASGFTLCTFNRVFYVSRDIFAWFLGATHQEIQTVTLIPCMCNDPSHCTCNSDHPGDHFRWELLDVDLCSADFEYTEQRSVYHASNVYREKWNKTHK